jgi:hypothetical protein
MTEQEWLTCADPTPMLEFLGDRGSGRKLRLLTVACCRRIWPLVMEAQCRQAVEIAERFADRLVAAEAQEAAHIVAERVLREVEDNEAPQFSGVAYATAYAASYTSHEKTTVWLACRAGVNAACAAAHALSDQYASESEVVAATHAEFAAQAALVRDLFRNPFRSSPPLPHAVLNWNDGTVRCLAQAIYEDRKLPEGTLDTARLAILADALLDAGCDDEELLSHLRSSGPHVRGCWAVDLILGKE